MYFVSENNFFKCQSINYIIHSEKGVRMASVLWFFHVARFFFDLVNTIQSSLTKSVVELKSEQAINEIRFTLTHFVVWWMILLYNPGGEVIFTVATVCLFYLGTIACAFSQGRFIKIKMIMWILLVVSNFGRLAADLWSGCTFPSAILTVSPPYDINSNVHMVMFYFFLWIPAGFILHYLLYGRGAVGSWWIVVVFLMCAHWPNSTTEEESKTLALSTVSVNNTNHRLLREKRDKSKLEGNSKVTSKQMISNIMLRKCSYFLCSNYEKEFKSYKVCKSCRAPYCSRDCQLKDWQKGNHKSFCKTHK